MAKSIILSGVLHLYDESLLVPSLLRTSDVSTYDIADNIIHGDCDRNCLIAKLTDRSEVIFRLNDEQQGKNVVELLSELTVQAPRL